MKLPCTIMRGGTSKGILLRRDTLPDDADERDRVILRVFGSPDRRQIDGLGGADPLTSKVAIVGPPTKAGADIDYLFGQVGIANDKVDYAGYCGNVLSAVAAYAVNEKYVRTNAKLARVTVHVVNAGRLVIAEVPVADGRAAEEGTCVIAGVPGSGAAIRLDFADTAGSSTGKLLPTGQAIDVLDVPGVGPVRVSIVDMANPMAFVEARALQLNPTDGPDELDSRKDVMAKIEEIRQAVARKAGIMGPDGGLSDNIPLVSLIGPAAEYTSYVSRERVPAATMDFTAREIFLSIVHKAYGVAETICTAAAAVAQGTIVQLMAGDGPRTRGRVRFGHPSGVIEVEIAADGEGASVKKAIVTRTARLIMDGHVHVPDSIF
ncbi:MAG: 3-methylitaconate isomerase [Rhodospirillales bacterium]|nr:3-methylitaconate isomerase [Rhodospirillales bacterium]